MKFLRLLSSNVNSNVFFVSLHIRFIMSPKMCDHKSKKKCKNKCNHEISSAEDKLINESINFSIEESINEQRLNGQAETNGSLPDSSETVVYSDLDNLLNGKEGDNSKKKSRAFREVDLERILFRWYDRKRVNSQDTKQLVCGSVSVQEILKKACNLGKRLGASEEFMKTLDMEWVRVWQERYGVFRDNTDTSSSLSSKSVEEVDIKEEKVSDENAVPRVQTVLTSDVYSDDQIYVAYSFQFDWMSLPDKTLEMQSSGDLVWLLMAGNKSGRHRTRVLITGKQWRPACLQNVNMLSQPIVYAGGGVGRLTPDLFTWWFHREFASAALALNAEGAVLVAEQSEFTPSPTDCVTADGKVKLVIYQKGDVCLDVKLIESELRTRYAMLLLHNAMLEQQSTSVIQTLSGFTLKDAFPLLHRAWLHVRPDSLSRCWMSSSTPETSAPRPPLSFDTYSGTPIHIEEDRRLLLELQWLCHDLGLEVTDEDLASWVSGRSTRFNRESCIKPEPNEPTANDEDSPPVSSVDAAICLSKALLWMESEPIDPNLLLVVRDVMAIAKQASKMGLGPGHPGTGLPFFCHNGEHLTQPPPAHMGIPPYQLDPKGAGEYWRTPVPPFTHTEWKRLGPLLAATGQPIILMLAPSRCWFLQDDKGSWILGRNMGFALTACPQARVLSRNY